jgi:signal transduction histidine kinase
MDQFLERKSAAGATARGQRFRAALNRFLAHQPVRVEDKRTFQMLRTLLFLVWGGYAGFFALEIMRIGLEPVAFTAAFGFCVCFAIFALLQRGKLTAMAWALTVLIPTTISFDHLITPRDPFPVWHIGVLVSPIVAAVGLGRRGLITVTLGNLGAIAALTAFWLWIPIDKPSNMVILTRASSLVIYLIPVPFGSWYLLNRLRTSEAEAQRARRTAEQHVTRLQTLLDIRHEPGDPADLGLRLNRIGAALSSALDDARTLMLMYADGDWLDLRLSANASAKAGARWRVDRAFDRTLLDLIARGQPAQTHRSGDGHAIARICQNLLTRNGCAHLFPSTANALVLPLMRSTDAIGMVMLIWPHGHVPSPSDKQLAEIYVGALVQTIEQDRVRRLEIERATLSERQRIARELHDSVSQTLYGIALAAQSITHDSQNISSRAVDAGNVIRDMSAAALSEMRALLNALQPPELTSDGLCGALRRHVQYLRAQMKAQIELTLPDVEPHLADGPREALYRIGAEALNNACRHAGAARIRLTLSIDPSRAWLCVEDDGPGFDPTHDAPGHHGLRGMRERAAQLGGALSIDSRITNGVGTIVTADLPVGA